MNQEVQINGKWYWELDRPETAAFFSEHPAYLWDVCVDRAVSKKLVLIVKKSGLTEYPYIADDGTAYRHAALLSNGHDKPEERKSRRCTKIELAEWLAKGNGMYQYDNQKWSISINIPETLFHVELGSSLKIRKWGGEPMEPTAENMGLPE